MTKTNIALLLALVAGVVAALLLHDRYQLLPIVARKGIPANGRLELTDAEWRERLTPEQYRITRQKGTERAYSGKGWDTKADGTYRCACCGEPLFQSETKYDSCTGWPSFWQPLDENRVSLVEEYHLGRRQMEVICSRCDAHLGHVFADGPKPTGQRYCMNATALTFEPRGTSEKAATDAATGQK